MIYDLIDDDLFENFKLTFNLLNMFRNLNYSNTK